MIAELTLKALDLLADVPPVNIFAGRKGQVAAARDGKQSYLLFRRMQNGIRLERWPDGGPDKIRYYGMIPTNLVPRVQAVLDAIP